MSGPPDSQGTPLAWSHSHPSLHSPPSMSERELGGVLGSLPWGPPRHGKPVAWSPAAPRVVSAAPACLDPRPRAVLGCPPQGPGSAPGPSIGPGTQSAARGVGEGRFRGGGSQWAEWRVTAGPSTEQQAASKAQREQELAASAFQELDDNMDGV